MRDDQVDFRTTWPCSDPVALAERLGLADIKQRSGGALALCPAHEDRHPSLSVRTGPDGLVQVRCWSSACNLSGDAYTLIGAAHRLDTKTDFRRIVDLAAVLANQPRPEARPAPPPKDPPLRLADFDRLGQALLRLAPLGSDVLEYLQKRGLHAVGWGALPYLRKDLAALAEALVAEVGLDVWQRSGLAHVHRGPTSERPCPADCAQAWVWPGHRLIIPWRNASGKIAQLQRRPIREVKKDSDTPKYVFCARARPAHPYGIEALQERTGAAVAICEGAIDAESLRVLFEVAGRDVVPLGVPGVQGWKAEWGKITKGRKVLIALDPDRAGESKVRELAVDCKMGEALDVVRVKPAVGYHDWNDELRGAV